MPERCPIEILAKMRGLPRCHNECEPGGESKCPHADSELFPRVPVEKVSTKGYEAVPTRPVRVFDSRGVENLT